MNLIEALIPIFICVVLPVMIVWIVGRTKQNETNRKAEIMLKALEKGVPVDPEMFKGPASCCSERKTIKKDLLERLNGACVTSLLGVAAIVLSIVVDNPTGWGFYLPYLGGVLLAIGVALFIVYFIGKKMMAKEIEAEEKQLSEGKE